MQERSLFLIFYILLCLLAASNVDGYNCNKPLHTSSTRSRHVILQSNTVPSHGRSSSSALKMSMSSPIMETLNSLLKAPSLLLPLMLDATSSLENTDLVDAEQIDDYLMGSNVAQNLPEWQAKFDGILGVVLNCSLFVLFIQMVVLSKCITYENLFVILI